MAIILIAKFTLSFPLSVDTVDESCVRNYIHVMDLAEGHVAVIEQMNAGTHIYYLGTGKGTSVLELARAFEEANNINVPYKIVDRRTGKMRLAMQMLLRLKMN
ncbi:hypothetical protein LZ480_03830 [Solibacillus sp. MA9]|uniref:UDP-glucose 4-epimerase n=1 Tax=Solibacillus palustris TaxID=2908203 RepID=A0ABS9U9K7_9BACL|nr:hypothetical protein [Solibacillus sp. MA9]MCH7321011.1 hypothetical protein [Solibacillus sp. MA9]